MHTLYDYITQVKGIEYIISILFIAGYILFTEVLKPKPFAAVAHSGKEDMDFMKKTGSRNILATVGRIAAAPFIGIAYIVALPFAFFGAVGTAALSSALSLAGKTAVFGWRPTEAYFSGQKKRKEDRKKTGEE